MNSKRVITFTLLIVISCGLLSGCYDRREIDDLTYVIAIGLDEGKTNNLRMTLQYAVPAAIGGGGMGGGGGGGGGGEGGNKSVNTVTVETPTLYSGLNMVNNFIGKQVNISHAKVSVISEELARSGKMHEYIHAMVRGREFRPNMYIAVSRGSAEDYIRSVKPIQELNPAKYYELKFSTYKYTGFTAETTLNNFYNQQESLARQPVATLVGVGHFQSSNDFDPNSSTYRNKGRPYPLEGDYLAGDTPTVSDIKSETMGLAVFDGTNMVGALDGQEATYHLIATGEYNYSYVTIQDPKDVNTFVVLNLKQSRKPAYKVSFDGGKPRISLKIKLEADYLSIQSGINYEMGADRELFEKSAEQFLKTEITRFLDRTAKEFKSDICGFGRFVKGSFLTWKEWEDFNWLGKYKDSTFDVDVDLKVRRPGLMIRSMPSVSSAGGGE